MGEVLKPQRGKLRATWSLFWLDNYSSAEYISESVADVVFAYFAIEMVIKMIAMGVWGKLGYLGDSWNRLGNLLTLIIN